jgi:hypothetical protein
MTRSTASPDQAASVTGVSTQSQPGRRAYTGVPHGDGAGGPLHWPRRDRDRPPGVPGADAVGSACDGLLTWRQSWQRREPASSRIGASSAPHARHTRTRALAILAVHGLGLRHPVVDPVLRGERVRMVENVERALARGPSFGRRSGRRTASGRGRTASQPFTTCRHVS